MLKWIESYPNVFVPTGNYGASFYYEEEALKNGYFKCVERQFNFTGIKELQNITFVIPKRIVDMHMEDDYFTFFRYKEAEVADEILPSLLFPYWTYTYYSSERQICDFILERRKRILKENGIRVVCTADDITIDILTAARYNRPITFKLNGCRLGLEIPLLTIFEHYDSFAKDALRLAAAGTRPNGIRR